MLNKIHGNKEKTEQNKKDNIKEILKNQQHLFQIVNNQALKNVSIKISFKQLFIKWWQAEMLSFRQISLNQFKWDGP